MNQTGPRISKLPFVIGDLALLAAAGYIAAYGAPMGKWQYVAMIAAVAFGAWLAAWPFVLDFRVASRLAESSQLTSATEKINDLDKVSASIANAVSEWQHLQHSATQTVTAAEQIAGRMTTDARNFIETLSRMDESEKKNLRLEIEKLRRSEADWLGITVRILDHIFALHQAGVRSGQRNIIEQLANFQNACRDATRRVGLAVVMPQVDVPFDPNQHRLLEGKEAGHGAVVSEVVAPGYSFQGQMIRLPIVSAKVSASDAAKAEDPQLTFESPGSPAS